MSEQLSRDGVPPSGWRRLLAEPRRPEKVRNHPGAPWLVVATVSVGAFMGQLDASIVTLAIPSIRKDFHASLAQVEWVALVYMLVLVASISVVGRLADMAGRKLLYTYGFAVFTIASLGCALSPDLGWLIAARLVQALGAAMLQANSVALIRTNIPAHLMGRAIGIQGAAQAVGLALGPSVGGLLIALGGWRWVFFVNLPAGVAGLLLGWFLLPRTRVRAPRTRFDWQGVLLLTPAVAALLFAFSEASGVGFAAPQVSVLIAASLVLLVLFALHQKRRDAPLVDVSLFAGRRFSFGIIAGLLSYLVLFGVLFITPLYLEGSGTLAPAQAGLLLTVLPAALALSAPFGGTLADRHGTRLPTSVGMAVASIGLGILLFTERPAPWLLAVSLAVVGVGQGLFTPANNASIASSGHAHQAGMVSGILNMTRGMGTSLGVAAAGAVYTLGVGVAGPVLEGAEPAAMGFRAAVILLTVLSATAAGLALLAGGAKKGAS